jgi:hypothetical protein
VYSSYSWVYVIGSLGYVAVRSVSSKFCLSMILVVCNSVFMLILGFTVYLRLMMVMMMYIVMLLWLSNGAYHELVVFQLLFVLILEAMMLFGFGYRISSYYWFILSCMDIYFIVTGYNLLSR